MYKIDMYSGKPYDKSKHGRIDIFWSDVRMRYWGCIYSKDKINGIIGDFTADSVREAEKSLGVKFNTVHGVSR